MGTYFYIISLWITLLTPIPIVIFGISWFLAAIAKKPIAAELRITTLWLAGIIYPLWIFGLSIFLMPEAKDDCPHGWLDCFEVGKLALTPVVLWACAAFYKSQISPSQGHPRKWIGSGLFAGAMVSGACLIWEGMRLSLWGGYNWFLLVPLYVFLWYATLFIRFFLSMGISFVDVLKSLLGMLPFWLLSVYWSYRTYLSLPKEHHGCFVVTAATRGHPLLVGPFTEISRRGIPRQVNQQLQTFWRFEELWQRKWPKTHRHARTFYNWLGPQVAGCIQTRWLADGVYLLLKPLELLAAMVVNRSR